MNNGRTRLSLLGVAALYLLHLALELYQNREGENTSMAPAVRILFVVLFVAAAAGLLIYVIRNWKRSGKEEEEQKRERDQDENSMR